MSVRRLTLAALSALAGLLAASAACAADPGPALVQKGSDLFRDNCGVCHLDVIGPPLDGVAGRPVAGLKSWSYSAALKAHGGTWTDANLDALLADSQAFAPGTSMGVKITDPADRAALVAYLKSLK